MDDSRTKRHYSGMNFPACSIRLSAIIIATLLLCLTGCATFEFDVIRPPEFAQHIGSEKEVAIQSGALEYKMQVVENRLVVRVFNQGIDPLQLLGDQSALTDPSGQAHPLRGMIIPPGAFLKLILPPTSHLQSGGPGYSGPGWEDGLGRSQVTAPLPPVTIGDVGAMPFDWPEDTDVRLLLTFQRAADEPFTQEWVFRKQKRS
jgi:hypothetical protein